jgi:lipoprotein-releasing system permease protein
MLKLFLWLRYLGKRRVVLLSIAAVALSCALLIVVASIFNSFINAFEQAAVDSIGDVVIAPPMNITDCTQLTDKLEEINVVEAATATLSTHGLLHLGRGNVRAVEIWGIDVQKQGKVTAFEKSLLKGNSQEPNNQLINGYIGIGVLGEPNEKTDEYDFESAKATIGREVVLTTGSTLEGRDGNRQFKRQTIQLVVSDVVFTGVYYLDKQVVYLPIEQLREAIYPASKQTIADQIHVKLHNGADEEVAIAEIRGVWKTFAEQKLGWEPALIQVARIETARQMQARYVAEFRKQMGILLLIFGVVSLSAVLLVFCIFYMIVERQRRDIAILKSCGADSAAVASIFVGFGLFVGTLGTLLGIALGYLVTKNIDIVEGGIRIVFGLKLWKSSVYMFSKIPNTVDWQAVLWIAASAIAGAAIGALIPAISAAVTKPVNVLRYE